MLRNAGAIVHQCLKMGNEKHSISFFSPHEAGLQVAECELALHTQHTKFFFVKNLTLATSISDNF